MSQQIQLDELALVAITAQAEDAEWYDLKSEDWNTLSGEAGFPAARDHIVANSPAVTLAIIDRVHELESSLADALFWLKPGLEDRSEERERDRASIAAVLHKQDVLL